MNVAPPGAQTAADRATPAVRAVAARLGVDLADVTPTGAGGRISTADVRAAAGVSTLAARGTTPPQAVASTVTPAFTASGLPGSALAGLPGPAMAAASAASTTEQAYSIAQACLGKSNDEALRILAADPTVDNGPLLDWMQANNLQPGAGKTILFATAGGSIAFAGTQPDPYEYS